MFFIPIDPKSQKHRSVGADKKYFFRSNRRKYKYIYARKV